MEADLLKVAKDCQFWARRLSPLQNSAGDMSPRSAIVRFFRWMFRRPCDRILARDMEKIVSSLLSAGNMLEYVARSQEPAAK